MKKLFSFLTLSVFLFTSCSSDGEGGPQGPAGPQGPPGEDGLIGIVFDVEQDFTADNSYGFEVFYEDYTEEEVYETDVVLVYLLTGQDGEDQGQPVDVWSPLPQLYYIDGGGSMQYNYDYTYFSTYIYLDGDVDLASLDADYTDNQRFRIAIVPAAFAQDFDTSNYGEVMNALQVENREIPHFELDK